MGREGGLQRHGEAIGRERQTHQGRSSRHRLLGATGWGSPRRSVRLGNAHPDGLLTAAAGFLALHLVVIGLRAGHKTL